MAWKGIQRPFGRRLLQCSTYPYATISSSLASPVDQGDAALLGSGTESRVPHIFPSASCHHLTVPRPCPGFKTADKNRSRGTRKHVGYFRKGLVATPESGEKINRLLPLRISLFPGFRVLLPVQNDG